MTLDELLRRIVRGHWVVIAVCLLLPVAATTFLQLRAERGYIATVRLQVSAAAPMSTIEADALGSRVLALATTPSIVRQALDTAKLNPLEAPRVARDDISSRRLGQSTVVELSVSDPGRARASALVAALAGHVAAFMNDANRGDFVRALAAVDKQLANASTALGKATAQLANLRDQQARPDLVARVQAAQAVVTQLATTRASMTVADASRDRVVVVDGQEPEVVQAPSALLPRAALALLLGLLLGIGLAVTIETLRPRLAGLRALARRFEAPILGDAGQRPAALANAITLAARRQGLEAVVLLGVDDADDDVAHRLLSTFAAPAGRAPDPAQALLTQPNGARAPRAPEAPVVTNGSSRQVLPRRVRFTHLAGVGPVDELTAGVVLVSSDAPRQRDVDTVEDILRTTRWPVLGVVGAHGARRARS